MIMIKHACILYVRWSGHRAKITAIRTSFMCEHCDEYNKGIEDTSSVKHITNIKYTSDYNKN